MIEFRKANASDIAPLIQITNSSYRPLNSNASWSNETEYMAGERINTQQLLQTLQQPNSVILVGIYDRTLVSWVLVEKIEDDAKIILLTINIYEQQKGYGKATLKAAENYALSILGANEIRMHVLQI